MEEFLLKIEKNKKLWDIFTRKEEYKSDYKDIHGRFPYFFSDYKDILKPKVSEYLIKNGIFNIEYPDKKRFAVCLTHDIDILFLSGRKIAKEYIRALKKFDIKNTIETIISSLYKRKSRLFNFEFIMDVEKKYGAKSTFFIMAIDKWDFEFNYRVEELKDEIRYIIENGFEIGLHGGYETYKDIDRMKKEKERVENISLKEVIGYRNHYLRFKIPITWELLKEAGFEYDSTFGYTEMLGFKNGMCHPFKPFNVNSYEFIDIFEFPLNIIDETLFTRMGLSFETAWEVVSMMIDETEKNKGVITILWHNTNFFGERLEFYERILEYCSDKNAWITSCEDIWRYFFNS